MRTFPGRSLLAPRFWSVHLLALVCVVAAVFLGAWQYDGWQERRAAEAADLTQQDPIPLAEAMGPDDPFPGERVGQPVTLDGSWVPEATVFVSGREHEGRSGFWVVTPLAVSAPDGPALP
ncbi:MAG: SURF1 family cytochrome oxidase biogenesis protein, partial [Nocardioides sp.]